MQTIFGKKIRKRRMEKEMSLGVLAERTGISKTYLSQIERGHIQNPSVVFMHKICTSLGITLADLFNRPVHLNVAYFDNIYENLPESLRELIKERGVELDIREEDIQMLQGIRYRGKRPATSDGWLHILWSIRFVVDKTEVEICEI